MIIPDSYYKKEKIVKLTQSEIDRIMEVLERQPHDQYEFWQTEKLIEKLKGYESDVSQCKHCYCITKTIHSKCGKCGARKIEDRELAESAPEKVQSEPTGFADSCRRASQAFAKADKEGKND